MTYKPAYIGISSCDKWTSYKSWIASLAHGMNIINLNARETTQQQISECCGIILTGGEDVHPSLYNKPEYERMFNLTDTNSERDEFELSVMEGVDKFNIPLLGICRGLQLANVFYGGTLIPDLPSVGKSVHSTGTKNDAFHTVSLHHSAALFAITGKENGEINSHHHQATDKPGRSLRAVALSGDGTIEGLEKQDAANNTFFTLVQWHPERMDQVNPFAGRLGESFVKACKKYAGIV